MPDKMPFRTVDIACVDIYEGWTVKIRTNVPFGTYMDVIHAMTNAERTNGQEVALHMHELLQLTVLEWDVKDENGDPVEVSMAGFARIPPDLLIFLVNQAQAEINKLPLLQSGSLPNSASQTVKKGKHRRST